MKEKAMAQIIDGRELAKHIRETLAEEVKELKAAEIYPKLAVVMVGEDKASQIYVRTKSKACEEIGIAYEEYFLPADTTMPELIERIEKLNNDETVHGILIQSSLPEGLDANEAFRTVLPKKDIDGFHPMNIGKLSLNQDCFLSCTPYGIMKMLDSYHIPLEGANAVIIGRSNIVGKPLAQCLLNKRATVTICHSKTQHLKELTKEADILVAAIGQPKFVTADMVKEGATVIDVGINRTEEGLVGDVDFDSVKEKAAYITPVPGGVGPMTVAMLMTNIVKAAKHQ